MKFESENKRFASLALTTIKTGNIGVNGATGAVLDRSLVGLRR